MQVILVPAVSPRLSLWHLWFCFLLFLAVTELQGLTGEYGKSRWVVVYISQEIHEVPQQFCICTVQLCSLFSLVLLGLLNTRLVTLLRLSSDQGEAAGAVQVTLHIQVWIPCAEGAVGVPWVCSWWGSTACSGSEADWDTLPVGVAISYLCLTFQ